MSISYKKISILWHLSIVSMVVYPKMQITL